MAFCCRLRRAGDNAERVSMGLVRLSPKQGRKIFAKIRKVERRDKRKRSFRFGYAETEYLRRSQSTESRAQKQTKTRCLNRPAWNRSIAGRCNDTEKTQGTVFTLRADSRTGDLKRRGERKDSIATGRSLSHRQKIPTDIRWIPVGDCHKIERVCFVVVVSESPLRVVE